MKEVTIIKAMYCYDLFVKYNQTIEQMDTLEFELKSIFGVLKEYYNKYSVETINHDEFVMFFYYKYPYFKDNEIYKTLLENINEVNILNNALLIDILNRIVEEHTKTKLAATATASLNDPNIGLIELQDIIDSGVKIIGAANDVETNVCNMPLDDMLSRVSPLEADRDLSFRSEFLREKFGGPSPCSLGHIFARPDTGKTSLAVFEACGFAKQLKDTDTNGIIVYANNEEDIKRVRLRAFIAMMNADVNTMREYSLEAEKRWLERGGDRLKFIGNVVHINEIEKILKTLKPRVLFIDQGPKLDIKMQFKKNASRPEKLQQLYNRLRELAKKYDPVSIITLGQADGDAEGRLYLKLSNLDYSKTGVPGELDWCLGIGKSMEQSKEFMRGFNICKNKLTGLYGQELIYFDVHKCNFGGQEKI